MCVCVCVCNTRIVGDGNLTDDVREGEGANEMEGKENTMCTLNYVSYRHFRLSV